MILDSSELVPGDLIEITNNLVIPADILLIYGKCVVRESTLGKRTFTKINFKEGQGGKLKDILNINSLSAGNKVI
jgi:Cft2 family RNA processing exonuclease